MIHPRREEGVNGGRVDQLSVIGKNSPEEQNDKLRKGTQLLSGMDTNGSRYGSQCFSPCPQERRRQRRGSLCIGSECSVDGAEGRSPLPVQRTTFATTEI